MQFSYTKVKTRTPLRNPSGSRGFSLAKRRNVETAVARPVVVSFNLSTRIFAQDAIKSKSVSSSFSLSNRIVEPPRNPGGQVQKSYSISNILRPSISSENEITVVQNNVKESQCFMFVHRSRQEYVDFCVLTVGGKVEVECSLTVGSTKEARCEIEIEQRRFSASKDSQCVLFVEKTIPKRSREKESLCELTVQGEGQVNSQCEILVDYLTVGCNIFVLQSRTVSFSNQIEIFKETPLAVSDLKITGYENDPDISVSWNIIGSEENGILNYIYGVTRSTVVELNTTTEDNCFDHTVEPGLSYIHVAVVHENGNVGPAKTLSFNHIPLLVSPNRFQSNQQASLFSEWVMLVDGVQGEAQIQSGKTVELSWTELTLNPGVNYKLQLSNNKNFVSNGANLVTKVFSGIENNYFSLESPGFGRFFWRIAIENSQTSSEWSPVSTFLWNRPPNKPTGLSAT